MKKIFALLCFLSLAIPMAFADMKLDPPEKLLEKARAGRIACREVILDIQQNIPEMRDPQTFDSYFKILDELEKIAAQTGVNEIYPDAVKNLGLQMVTQGVRWLSTARDTIEKILAYHKWMSVEVAFSFLAATELEEKTLPPENLRRFAENIDQLIPWVDKAFPQATGLRLGYRNLLSERAAKALAIQSMTEEERLFWLDKIYSSTGYASALGVIQNDVFGITKENREKFHLYVHRQLLISNRLLADAQNHPFWLINQAGDTALNTISRGIYIEADFSDEDFVGLLKVMQPLQLQRLVQIWVSRPPAETYLEKYVHLSGLLMDHLKAQTLQREAMDVFRFYGRISVPFMTTRRKLEGTYKLTSPKGRVWKLTIVRSRFADVYVALGEGNFFIVKSFFNVVYDRENDIFIAHERDRTLDNYRNLMIRFKASGNGAIEVDDFTGPPNEQKLRGRKIESFPDYFSTARRRPTDPAGMWKGYVYFDGGQHKEINLSVTKLPGGMPGAFGEPTMESTTGRLFEPGDRFFLDFNVGSAGTDSVLYLTSGNQGGGGLGWVQMRGIITGNEYRGYYIVGGRGIAGREFVLRRVSK